MRKSSALKAVTHSNTPSTKEVFRILGLENFLEQKKDIDFTHGFKMCTALEPCELSANSNSSTPVQRHV